MLLIGEHGKNVCGYYTRWHSTLHHLYEWLAGRVLTSQCRADASSPRPDLGVRVPRSEETYGEIIPADSSFSSVWIEVLVRARANNGASVRANRYSRLNDQSRCFFSVWRISKGVGKYPQMCLIWSSRRDEVFTVFIPLKCLELGPQNNTGEWEVVIESGLYLGTSSPKA